MTTLDKTCACCGGRELRAGKIMAGHSVWFRPEGDRWWPTGVPVKARVCMGCGAVWPYLEPEKLAKMRERLGPA